MTNAAGVQALSFAAARKLPMVKVATKAVVAEAQIRCPTAWFDFKKDGLKIGFSSTGCAVERLGGVEVLSLSFTLSVPQQGFQYISKRVFATAEPGRLLEWETSKIVGPNATRKTLRTKGKQYTLETVVMRGAAVVSKRDQPVKQVEENLSNSEMAIYALLRQGALKPGGKYRYAWFDPDKGIDKVGAMQVLASRPHVFGDRSLLVHKLELLMLSGSKRAELYVDANARLLNSSQEGAQRLRNSEAAARVMPTPKGKKKRSYGALLDWILANLGIILGVGIALIVVISTTVGPAIKKIASGGGSPAKAKGVGAAIARHLLKKKWVVGSEHDSLWSFEEDEDENEDLDLKNKSQMATLYKEQGFFGHVGPYFAKVAKDRWEDETPQFQVEVQLYWDNHKTKPKVDLNLETGDDGSKSSGQENFDTGHAGFDDFFQSRHANHKIAKRYARAGNQLDFVGQFAERWGKDVVKMEVSDTIEAKFRERILIKAEDPRERLDALLADLAQLAAALEGAIDPSFHPAPPPDTSGPRYVSMEVISTCPKCRSGLPLNGPILDVTCSSCSSTFTLSEDFWDLLEDPDKKFTKGHGGFNRNMNTDFRWKVARPACQHCSEELPVDDISPGSDGPVFCPACGHKNVSFPAPDWLRDLVPRVEQIYGAERDAVAGAASASPLVVPEQASAPVAMACPQCSGALSITADMERTIACGYCQVEVFLPDELWKRLHPMKTATAWYARFAPK